MEIWGLCEGCERWFYCEAWFDRGRPEPTCPVCAREAVAIENRAEVEDLTGRGAPHGELFELDDDAEAASA